MGIEPRESHGRLKRALRLFSYSVCWRKANVIRKRCILVAFTRGFKTCFQSSCVKWLGEHILLRKLHIQRSGRGKDSKEIQRGFHVLHYRTQFFRSNHHTKSIFMKRLAWWSWLANLSQFWVLLLMQEKSDGTGRQNHMDSIHDAKVQ